jgi:hypothetical protein
MYDFPMREFVVDGHRVEERDAVKLPVARSACCGARSVLYCSACGRVVFKPHKLSQNGR